MSAPRRFEVPPAGKAAWVTLMLLAVVLPCAGLGVAFGLDPPDGDGQRWILLATLAFVLLLGAGLAALLRRRSVELAGATLTVRAAMYTRRVPVATLDLDQARVVDLREHRALRPQLKTNGYALPGFHAGYFRMRGGGAAFALVTAPERVLVLPVPGERTLLLSLARPTTLLDALRSKQRDR